MATLQELRNLTVRRLRDEGFTSLVSDQDYTDAVNEGQEMLAESLKLFTTALLTSTVDGISAYNLSDRFLDVYPACDSVVYTDASGKDYELTAINYDLYRTFDIATGTPKFYLIHNDKVTLYPAPDYTGDNNLYIESFVYPATLVGLSQESDFPDKYKQVISYFAASIVCEWQEAYDQQERMENKGRLRLNSLISVAGVADNAKNTVSRYYFGG